MINSINIANSFLLLLYCKAPYKVMPRPPMNLIRCLDRDGIEKGHSEPYSTLPRVLHTYVSLHTD